MRLALMVQRALSRPSATQASTSVSAILTDLPPIGFADIIGKNGPERLQTCCLGTAGHSLHSHSICTRRRCFSYHGEMADIWLVNGQGLAPSDFGSTEAGVFSPKPDGPDVTLTANSFHLDFEDPSNLGKDVSGLDNHFTNFQVTQPSAAGVQITSGLV